MPPISANLSLPYMAEGQAQKHVTFNEAMEIVDALAQLTVVAFDAETPPASATDGAVWALGAVPTGAWADAAGQLAVWSNGGWLFVPPRGGWRAVSDGELRVFDGAEWVAPTIELNQIAGLGIQTGYDTTNRLAVAAEATLLTHAGAGHQLKLNKAAAGDTASLLFQTGFSGRAEMGTAGSDDFSVKVSADGSAWFTAVQADRTTGLVSLPHGLTVSGPVTLAVPLALGNGGTGATSAAAARTNLGLGSAATATVTTSATDTTAGRLLKVGDFSQGIVYRQAINPGFASGDTTPEGIRAALGNVDGFYVGASTTSGREVAFHTPSYPTGFGVLRGYCSLAYGTMWQEITSNVVNRTWRRQGLTATTWTPWAEVYSQASVLGTVAHSGGVPTGALIQRGSNANGEFVRFADGTQICTHAVSVSLTIDAAFMGGFRSGVQVWGFPAAFAAAPSVHPAARSLTAFSAFANTPSTTVVQYYFTAVTSQTAATRDSTLIAIGRWF